MKDFEDLYKSSKKKNKKPKFSNEQIISQAIHLHLKGNIPEAEKYYQKLISEECNDHRVFSNYGGILQGLGKLKKAESFFRKAIELSPDFADAHANLGNILREIGKLEEAEIYTRKAIELYPDFANAHFNLGSILIDLGKLEKLILLSKSTIDSKTINNGYKLSATLHITIANLLQRNYVETSFYLSKCEDLISQGAINLITKENRMQTSAFFKFINSLYPLLEKRNNPEATIIPHIGESHCLSFAHQTLFISSKFKQIQPVLIKGGKAWHFSNDKSNKWKDSLTQQIKNHNYSDEIFISFGEIDCRKNEGILNYAFKNNQDISEVCEKTIKGYLDYMEGMLSPNYSKKYYFGVPAPKREKELLDEIDIKRIKMIKRYNEYLKKEVLSRGSYFLDVFALTANKNGENNNLYMCDQIHLSPECLSILFENYLDKSINPSN